jgi:hypothetical protein
MRIKQTILATILVLTICTFWSLQVGAYGLFTADPPASGQCSQCHTDFPGATHDVHTAAFNCSACHSFPNPVQTSTCIVCHDGSDTLNLHGGLQGPGDEYYCGYCHAGVDTETQSWGELKALFH